MKNYSKKIIGTLDEWAVVVSTYNAENEKINNNELLSPLGKASARTKLDKEIEKQQREYEKKWNNAWAEFKKDTTLAKGTSKAEDRQFAMQMILSLGEELKPEVFNDIIEPLKEDVAALKQIKALTDKVGVSKNIETTEAFKLIKASESLEKCTKKAEELGKMMIKDQETSLTYGITKTILEQMLNGAEEQLEILNK